MFTGTTHRYMSTLVAMGYLIQGEGRKYRLTLASTTLGMSSLASTSLGEHARPYLEDLRTQTGYTTSLAVLDGEEILYIERLPSIRRERRPIELAPGARLAAYCTAMGKTLLASLPAAEQHALMGELRLQRLTPSTITSKTQLRAELHTIAEEGIAVNDQELAPGLCAIAAPIRDASEAVAAISIAAPAANITLQEMVTHLTPQLLATAGRISARLGYRRRDEQ